MRRLVYMWAPVLVIVLAVGACGAEGESGSADKVVVTSGEPTLHRTWRVVNVVLERVAVVPPSADAHVEFVGGGELAGFAACSDIEGQYIVDGSRVLIAPSPLDARCAVRDRWGSALVRALATVDRWEIVDSLLVLTGDDGGTTIVLDPAPLA